MSAISLLHAPRTVQSDFGTAITTVLPPDVSHPQALAHWCTQFVLSSLTKLFCQDGLMERLELTELTIANYSGQSTMLTREVLLLLILLATASSYALEVWRVIFAFGKSAVASLSLI
jgi:hypothetical protein